MTAPEDRRPDLDLDRETARAVEALVFRLRNRDDSDDEWFAREFLAALKAQGWRPTLARPSPDWRTAGDSHLPSAGRPGGADYLAKKAEINAKARVTGPQQALGPSPLGRRT